ncbi:hypothetical protein OHR68_03030 [Spirillospora sp. NBC_00431]
MESTTSKTGRPPLAPTLLLLAALPAGLLVTLIDVFAFSRTKAALPDARPSVNAHAVDPALAEFAEFGPHRITLIAGFFAVATLMFAALAWTVRRGAFRRPAALLLAAGTLTAIYLTGLFLVYAHDPVHDFSAQHIQEPEGGLAGVPWAMDTVSPGWYGPALAAVVIAAATAAVAGCVLLTRARTSSWIAGRSVVEISARRHRTSTLMLMSMPAMAVLYAAVNLAAITAAANGRNEFVDEAAGISRGINFAVTSILIVVAAGWTITGVCLRHGRTWPGALAAAGALLIVHLLALRLAWDYQPLGSDAFADDQSGLLENRPSWHAPALALTLGLAAAWPLAALLGPAALTRRTPAGQTS